MTNIKDLIEQLQHSIFRSPLTDKAAEALTQLIAGKVSLPRHPEPMIMQWSELEKQAIEIYGDRRAAAAVLAERERCAKICDDTGPDDTTGDNCAALIRKGTP